MTKYGRVFLVLLSGCLLSACSTKPTVDILLTGGRVFDGNGEGEKQLDIGICGDTLCLVEAPGSYSVAARQVIKVDGMIVSPGFIDPHTHSFEELQSDTLNGNLNYLYQGVTTVVNGNDGGGPVDIQAALDTLNPKGIGTNVALFTGHGSLRTEVMGNARREAAVSELAQMKQLMEQSMAQGSLGLSSGLYYVPGSFAPTSEVIELAKVAAAHHGIYDTHLRDEGTFSIGFLAALQEAIDIGRQAGVHLHLAHIKALGVDVWGQSQQAIELIESAQKQGLSVSADQYPWQASGTFLRSAVVPKWAMEGSEDDLNKRLNDPSLQQQLEVFIKENIRVRGGPDSLLVTASEDKSIIGKTLAELAASNQVSPARQTIEMVKLGRTRVASFNMSSEDIERFMVQPWVVTSSDGTNGHPRKFASFPKKYRQYVAESKLLSLSDFIHRNSGLTARILGLSEIGVLEEGKKADILVFNPDTFREQASFNNWNALSTGVLQLFVNGQQVIRDGEYTQTLAGRFVKPSRH